MIICDKTAAYVKIFGKKPGFIAEEWIPIFLALYRGNDDFDTIYANGKLSILARDIYSLLREKGQMDAHALKTGLHITKEGKSSFESALIELQHYLLITAANESRLLTSMGKEVAWPVSNFVLIEDWFSKEILATASKIDRQSAYEMIISQAKKMNPDVSVREVEKFLGIEKHCI